MKRDLVWNLGVRICIDDQDSEESEADDGEFCKLKSNSIRKSLLRINIMSVVNIT